MVSFEKNTWVWQGRSGQSWTVLVWFSAQGYTLTSDNLSTADCKSEQTQCSLDCMFSLTCTQPTFQCRTPAQSARIQVMMCESCVLDREWDVCVCEERKHVSVCEMYEGVFKRNRCRVFFRSDFFCCSSFPEDRKWSGRSKHMPKSRSVLPGQLVWRMMWHANLKWFCAAVSFEDPLVYLCNGKIIQGPPKTETGCVCVCVCVCVFVCVCVSVCLCEFVASTLWLNFVFPTAGFRGSLCFVWCSRNQQ